MAEISGQGGVRKAVGAFVQDVKSAQEDGKLTATEERRLRDAFKALSGEDRAAALEMVRASGFDAVASHLEAAPVKGASPEVNPRDVASQALVRDLPRGPKRDNALKAMEGFSTEQLQRMAAAGVRMGGKDFLPDTRKLPGDDAVIEDMKPTARARYVAEKRVVQIKDGCDARVIQHELAHAWDEVRNDNVQVKDSVSPAQQQDLRRVRGDKVKSELDSIHQQGDKAIGDIDEKLKNSPGRKEREALQKERQGVQEEVRDLERIAADGKGPAFATDAPAAKGQMSMKDMLEQYRKNTRGSDAAFDTTGKTGHSKENVKEFYAEGYAAFQEGGMARDALRKFAPALYAHLYREAARDGTLPADAPKPG